MTSLLWPEKIVFLQLPVTMRQKHLCWPKYSNNWVIAVLLQFCCKTWPWCYSDNIEGTAIIWPGCWVSLFFCKVNHQDWKAGKNYNSFSESETLDSASKVSLPSHISLTWTDKEPAPCRLQSGFPDLFPPTSIPQPSDWGTSLIFFWWIWKPIWWILCVCGWQYCACWGSRKERVDNINLQLWGNHPPGLEG